MIIIVSLVLLNEGQYNNTEFRIYVTYISGPPFEEKNPPSSGSAYGLAITCSDHNVCVWIVCVDYVCVWIVCVDYVCVCVCVWCVCVVCICVCVCLCMFVGSVGVGCVCYVRQVCRVGI